MRTWNVALIGECMIELQGTDHSAISLKFGGDTLNTAIYLARLGAARGVRVEYVSALGDDPFSEQMRAFWHSENVGSALTRSLPGKLPGLYFISLEEGGERVFSYWRGESAAKDVFDAPGAQETLKRLGEFDLVYLSGISLAILREKGREALLRRLEELRARGAHIVFDANYRTRLWGPDAAAASVHARARYARMLRLSRTVLLTREELVLFGLSPEAADAQLQKSFDSLGPEEIVVKNGGEPCLVWREGRMWDVRPEPVANVVDTTAAGDSFSAAYLLARHLELDAPDAVRQAHRLAGAVVSHKGAIIPRECMPDIFQ